MLILSVDINVMIVVFYLLLNSTFEVILGLSILLVCAITHFAQLPILIDYLIFQTIIAQLPIFNAHITNFAQLPIIIFFNNYIMPASITVL
jgi:hypothetical protein